MSTDKLYGDWEKHIDESARPWRWRDLLWILAKGALIGLLVVAMTRGF